MSDIDYLRVYNVLDGERLGLLWEEIGRLRAELAEHERWLREMVEDYRLLADDHRVSRQCAINGLIHELRAERDALRAFAEKLLHVHEDRQEETARVITQQVIDAAIQGGETDG